MRDGVRLATDIYSPDWSKPLPVLLQRTPYNRKGAANVSEKYAAAGYTVVVQDTRGRFESEGSFYPYNNEGQDGYDTLEWIAQQSWSNGRVGTWGASYVGAVQYQAAAENPTGLAVMCPTATWNSFYRNIYHGGAARLALIATAATSLYPPPAGKALPVDWYKVLLTNPLTKLDLNIGWSIPWLRTILTHNQPDGFWRRLDVTSEVEQLSVPAQHVVGYYDFFLRETVANFERMRKKSSDQQLILGPWDHGSIGKQKLGDVDFGPGSQFDLVEENLRWFNRYLSKRDTAGKPPAVRYFSMGDNTWRSSQQWPPEDTLVKSFYLNSGGHANTRRGDGRLTTILPKESQPTDVFVSDPADPTPALPASFFSAKFNPFWGPVDQRAIEDREDVLVYDSGPLKQPLSIAGPLAAEIWVSADTPDADWVVKLIDVWPTGFAQNIGVGVQRSSFLKVPVKASQVSRVSVDLGHVAIRLAPQHSLRVEICGAYFPLFDRNLNTGEGPNSARSLRSTQKIYHRPEAPSRIIVHVRRDEVRKSPRPKA